ncbi:MAG: hypothetical protein U0168_18265 [Nannocystaceae bacterium]
MDPSQPPSPLPAALAVPGADAHALELRAHLGEGAAAITIADAAARSGLSLADAEPRCIGSAAAMAAISRSPTAASCCFASPRASCTTASVAMRDARRWPASVAAR